MGFVWRVYFFCKDTKKIHTLTKNGEIYSIYHSILLKTNVLFAYLAVRPSAPPFPIPRQGCLTGLFSKRSAEACPPPGFPAHRLAPLQPPSSCAAGTPNSPPPTLLSMC